MTNPRLVLAVSLAAGTLVVFVATIAVGGALRAGLAPWPGIAVVAMATAAFVLSEQQESFLVPGLLAASGVVGVAYGLIQTGFLAAATFPGPVFGVIIGFPVLGLGVAKVVLDLRRRRRPSLTAGSEHESPGFVKGFHGVRYQVSDVGRAVTFYTGHFGFKLERQQLPAFASVSLGDLHLLLSGPGASGSRPMPGGPKQEPGGWNRIVLRVTDLPAVIDTLKNAGLRVRNEIEVGPGGSQVQVEDPDGNPIELFEPAR